MSHQILPEHIRNSLAQYEKHQQCTCLHCGYSGLMGITREEKKVSNTKGIIILICFLSPLALYSYAQQLAGKPIVPWWLGLLVGVGVAAYSMRTQDYLACPNCNIELKVK